jgi:hypothetical protein
MYLYQMFSETSSQRFVFRARETPSCPSTCAAYSEHGGKSTREGAKNGVGRRERMKRDRGINDQGD